MLKTLPVVVVVVVAAVGIVLVYAATRPDTFRVERSVRIAAPPQRIYALIGNLRRFNMWNPYERKDPQTKGRYSVREAGPGAIYAWDSDKVGVGQMEIVDVAEPSRVTMNLDFIKPFEAHNVADFTLKPIGDATEVTWAMHGPAPYVSKLIQVFVSMDTMVGKDFEDGLNNLKTLAEAS